MTTSLDGKCELSLPQPQLWTQAEAAQYLRVSTRWLRDSSVPTILLPGNGPRGRRTLRYDAQSVVAWARGHSSYRKYK